MGILNMLIHDTDMLRKEFKKIRVPKTMYSINPTYPYEAYLIEQLPDGRWCYYFTERGAHIDEKIFDTEEEACTAFYAWVYDTLKLVHGPDWDGTPFGIPRNKLKRIISKIRDHIR